jgi:hypothetical protein
MMSGMRLLLLASVLLTGCGFLPSSVSPLINAVRSGDIGKIHELAASGANLDEPGGVNGWTPLMHAIHKDQLPSVRTLLELDADVNRSAGGTTPLIMAAGYGYTDIVEALLKAGADARATARDGANALEAAFGGSPDLDHFTVGRCQTATVEALLTKDPGLKIKEESEAFKTAEKAGCKEEIALLSQ